MPINTAERIIPINRPTITDITGKIVFTTTAGATQRIEVSTIDFGEGVHVARIQTADFIEIKKLIIAK